ncbi:cystathionine gamma-synthase-like protein [Myriangium duriaei CBS 260.36]|uniref:cystathionine gamma-synthase n=1 Tax=Myriangium duriaei CBS 260.36 TaxID=1168546 RepID=A0A9P4MMM5_9PEZI|nr:cystathionine gamma-synthase-like protein [Myriangium duriaei CBS 260.36]
MHGTISFNDNVGESIPADTPHAVSVSLPTWKANVGYEEGQKWVVERMKTGYPRFFVHKSIDRLATTIVAKHGTPGEKALLMPTEATAQRCMDFITAGAASDGRDVHALHFVPDVRKSQPDVSLVLPQISAVLFPESYWPHAKAFWQHTGEGVSSRRAEFCEQALSEGRMVEKSTIQDTPRMKKGPRRYQKRVSISGVDGDLDGSANGQTNGNTNVDTIDPARFVEERFGRNLNATLAEQAKLAIRRRIAGSLSSDMDLHEALEQPEEVEKIRVKDNFSVDDVYLYPCGMNSIFHAHRNLMLARGPMKSIMYGFPYVDTLKILEKFGPGALFYGHGSSADLDDLESRLKAGERFLALFCEFPGNPLLKTPDLKRIRHLATTYDFAIVVDETIGNFLNVHVLPDADVVVSSLTKVFSGDSNVMGGSMILNPSSQYYTQLKSVLAQDYTDNMFADDALFLERNSRDFVSRIARINSNADVIADILAAQVPNGKVKAVNYPRTSPTRPFYDAYRLPNAGYGGLLSCTFHTVEDAELFYDALDTAKGPSLGTNFTLSSPFVLLAHYGELEWAAQYGCEMSLVRFSVGLEDADELRRVFSAALDAVPARTNGT